MSQAAAQPVQYTLSTGQRVYRTVKRVLDFLVSLASMAILFLPMLILALVIKLDDRAMSLS